MEEFDHLKIQLKDIMLATNNFAPNKRIGGGGFGSVYKGELSRPDGLITVACKRLDPKFGQGHVEFLKEIVTLSKYKHENLVSLLHFCIEGDERILVYEYASRGSLDCYLSDPSLTWTQRLKICVGVAHALNYLHDPWDTHQRILHRDIKSANILLDEEWNAKVSDFGLSKIGPANQPQTYVVSNAVGTPGYCDPMYVETGILTKESDVYSFGVVLFEVMCGTICYEYRDGSFHAILVPMWKKCYKEKRLDDIIFHGIKEDMEPRSLETFSTIAYQCLKRDHEKRPTTAKIIQRLEMELEEQRLFENVGKRMSFEELRRMANLSVFPLSYTTYSELVSLLKKGVLVDKGETCISVNKKWQQCELISAQKCIALHKNYLTQYTALVSRFESRVLFRSTKDLRLRVKTQFLSPNVTYIINLVYECGKGSPSMPMKGPTRHLYRSFYGMPQQHDQRIPLKYKLKEMREYASSCVAHVGEDGWLRTELFQFTSTKKEHSFDIKISSEMKLWISVVLEWLAISVEGIEFCPVDLESNEDKVDMQPTDNDWVERMPDDYHKIVKDHVDESMTPKEVYFLLRKGLYINNSQQWFSISKKSKKRLMLPARAFLTEKRSLWSFKLPKLWKALPDSRFNKAAECCNTNHLAIGVQIESRLLSPDITYACYLVFKLPENASKFKGVVITSFKDRFQKHYKPTEHYIYLLAPPHTPVIEVSPGVRPSRTRKIKGHPKVRKDGWMEVPLWEFLLGSNSDSLEMDGYLKSYDKWNFTGLLIQGIEFRPAKFNQLVKPVSM